MRCREIREGGERVGFACGVNLDALVADMAAKLHAAFGPCSVMVECHEVSAIAAEIKADGLRSVVDTYLTVERIWWEREAEAEIERSAGSHRAIIEEAREHVAAIEARLIAAGFLKGGK